MDDTSNGSANAQFLVWVKEWLDLARERNSKGITMYKHAYDSLRSCPIVFQHPAELQQLKGFGPKLCERLTDKLKVHCAANGLPMPDHPQARKAAQRPQDGNGQAGDDDAVTRPAKRARKPKPYVPTFRSGAFALILALSTQSEDATVGMTKTELVEIAQTHCDSSFSAPNDPTKFYTAWSSIKTLLQKELVYERGRPLRRYALTDDGWDVAKRIKDTKECRAENAATENGGLPSFQDSQLRRSRSVSVTINAAAEINSGRNYVVGEDPSMSEHGSLPTFTPIRLPPGSFSVHLLLDVREVRAKTDRDYMQEELAKQGAAPIMRSLELGDAQWVAKCHDPGFLARFGAEGDEIVLDWIVERKRLDDLIGSIKDGRFHEQKFRLKRSGVKKVIYIIEDITMDVATYQRYEDAVQSAIASTQMVNGYFVKRTSKMDETIKYLARMTSMLKKSYEQQTLNIIPTKVLTAQNYIPLLQSLRETQPLVSHYTTYPAFASIASKSEMITLRDLFLKMLMTTKGLTGERALEIQRQWQTPCEFVKAFEACGQGEAGQKRKRDLVFTHMGQMVGRKKVSKQLSQRIAEVWGDA